MTRRPIRNRLILTSVVVIAAILGATGLIIETERRAAIGAFRTATMDLGGAMSQQTTLSIGLVDRALSEIQAGLTSSLDVTAQQINTAMRLKSTYDGLVDQRKRLSYVDSIVLANADGRLENATPGWPAAGADLSGTDLFKHLSTTPDHGIFAGAPIKEPVTGKWSVAMARRIDDAHGRFAGLAMARVSLSDMQAFFKLATPASRSIYLLRDDGLVLLRYPPREDEIGRTVPDQSPWHTIAARGGGSYQGPAYFDDTQIIASIRKLHHLPLVIETSVTEAGALSNWYRRKLWIGLGCLTAIIGVVVLLRLLARQYRDLEFSELSLAAKITQLDFAHRQLDATLANLSQGVCFFDQDSKLLVRNDRYCEMYGLAPESIRPGMSLEAIAQLRVAAGNFAQQSIADYVEFIGTIVRAGKPHDTTVTLSNGRIIEVRLRPLPGIGGVATHEDITEQREAASQIAFLARHDTLTGLANRTLFQDRLQQALAMSERGQGFAMLCLDLDRFKAVNDTHGHAIGDSLLRAVAIRLRDAVRDGDTIARLGGDEFAILLPGVTAVCEISTVAARIVQAICEPYDFDGRRASVGTSIGIAVAPRDTMHPEELLKAADLALYRAKRDGRGTWRFFEPGMDLAASARRALEADLRCALPQGQLAVHYQPVIRCNDRIVSGFEALLRWHHPTRGLVPPGEFIAVAEDAGLINDIGIWVLQRACTEATFWPDHLRVAVNLSTRQFRGRVLVDAVAQALRTSGLPAERLELEITESLPLQEDQATLSILHDLRALGVRIALDDFGTGYSSISYLRSFPFDTIKIDRSFVSRLPARDGDAAIVRGILGLASSLRVTVTAEGVETEDQFDFLAAGGCTEIQGFLISKAVPAGEIPWLLERLSAQPAWVC